ncbi:guanylyl cyclase [Labrys miyagiensis]|uniref:Guanylyl cyclase n=1 Tax=Labrys miyagiensis TaxID=346912 RepID=A0ABQ6CRF6_9HYPH|nr:adenylate/guanylate cyclase domain-containing protein [Labrys miyagiensis]GLS22923.1 guanylyl cyclase [Labrys miyagiensis]
MAEIIEVRHLQDRRLVAILAADIAGYSRLMGQDEAATIADLKAHQAVVLPMVGQYGGQIIDLAGDGILGEFPSAVRAVECAVAIQRTMADRNREASQDRRMLLRIGVHLGDIVHDDKRVYGDGVNVAARLEQLATPGGICVSKIVFKEVERKIEAGFESLGEQKLKNITEPVGIYRVLLDTAAVGTLRQETWRHAIRRRWRRAVAIAMVAALAVAGVGVWQFLRPQSAPSGFPSIAVLPFVNLSGDKDEDYFSDGLTEDLLTDLARLPRLVVLSRNATAGYKGQTVDVPRVGRDLGARYIVEGSVQRAGDQMRVTAQLIEASSNAHVWAQRYDRPTKDVFAVQDEITASIAGSLVVNISQEDLERAKRKPPTSLSAYELFLRGHEQLFAQQPESLSRAIELFDQAIAADPTYADAIGQLSQVYFLGFVLHRGPLVGQAAIDRATQLAQRAVTLDPTSLYAGTALAQIYLFSHRIDEAVAILQSLLAANPGSDVLQLRLGDTYTYAGQPERGVALLRQALLLNPRSATYPHAFIGRGLLLLNRLDEAATEIKLCIELASGFRPCHEVAAVIYAELGRLDEARVAAVEAHRLDPSFTLTSAPDVLPFKNPKDLQRFLDGLRKAGLPER